MLSFLELGVLSSHVYHPSLIEEYGYKITALSKKSILQQVKTKFNGVARVIDVAFQPSPSNDFYAALYINFQHGKATDAVIAFRGTVTKDWGNVLTDIYSWYSSAVGSDYHDHIPWYFDDARMFVYRAKTYLKENFPELNLYQNLTYTGHSLGGALAQLMTLMDHPAACCVFNSPVCRHIVPESSHEHWHLVNNVNARYGVINKVGGTPLGKLNVIDNPVDEAEAKALSMSFNRQDYVSGKVLSKLGNTTGNTVLEVKGSISEVEALASSTTGLIEMRQAKLEVVECDDEHQYAWMTEAIGHIVGKDVCKAEEFKKLLFSVPDVIRAQHSIDNMVTALQNSKITTAQVV